MFSKCILKSTCLLMFAVAVIASMFIAFKVHDDLSEAKNEDLTTGSSSKEVERRTRDLSVVKQQIGVSKVACLPISREELRKKLGPAYIPRYMSEDEPEVHDGNDIIDEEKIGSAQNDQFVKKNKKPILPFYVNSEYSRILYDEPIAPPPLDHVQSILENSEHFNKIASAPKNVRYKEKFKIHNKKSSTNKIRHHRHNHQIAKTSKEIDTEFEQREPANPMLFDTDFKRKELAELKQLDTDFEQKEPAEPMLLDTDFEQKEPVKPMLINTDFEQKEPVKPMLIDTDFEQQESVKPMLLGTVFEQQEFVKPMLLDTGFEQREPAEQGVEEVISERFIKTVLPDRKRPKRSVGSAMPWLCESEIVWLDLGVDYFPRFLRSVVCKQKQCWWNNFWCRPKAFTVKVLRRVKDTCVMENENLMIETVPKFYENGNVPSELREQWMFEEKAITFCCECSS